MLEKLKAVGMWVVLPLFLVFGIVLYLLGEKKALEQTIAFMKGKERVKDADAKAEEQKKLAAQYEAELADRYRKFWDSVYTSASPDVRAALDRVRKASREGSASDSGKEQND